MIEEKCMNNKSIKELYEGLNSGEFTSVELVKHCLDAIANNDQSGRCLNSIAEVEPNALFIAEALAQGTAKRSSHQAV